jgi:hypothetical protein
MKLISVNETVFNPEAIDIIQPTADKTCVAKFRGGEGRHSDSKSQNLRSCLRLGHSP